MRRLLSILLLAVFGLPLIAPLAARGADAEGSLPACCRRGGVHHCMGAMGQTAPAGTNVGAVHAKCPYCPASVASVHPAGMLAKHTVVASTPFASGGLRLGQTAPAHHAMRGDACPKRGPPALFLL